MTREELQDALLMFKTEIERSIQTSIANGVRHRDGSEAKNALIRSQRPIRGLHNLFAQALMTAATSETHAVLPPLGYTAPECAIAGFFKKKKQDIVILTQPPRPEAIAAGPLAGEHDEIGLAASNSSIIVGIRSQISSINKNFDTLMERALAESVNLRMRIPDAVLGDVYLLPTHEYLEPAMKENVVAFSPRVTNLPKFISMFLALSEPLDTRYKYDRSCLVIADFRQTPPMPITSLDELITHGFVPATFQEALRRLENEGIPVAEDLRNLSPLTFAEDIWSSFEMRRMAKSGTSHGHSI